MGSRHASGGYGLVVGLLGGADLAAGTADVDGGVCGDCDGAGVVGVEEIGGVGEDDDRLRFERTDVDRAA